MHAQPRTFRMLRRRKKHQHASDLLEGVVREHRADTISIKELKAALHERGFGFMMMLFALPLCLPIPVPPGYTTVFSVPLLFFSVQMLFGMDSPWLPEWISKRELKRTSLASIVNAGAPWLRKIEKLLSPRWYFASTRLGEKFLGFFCFLYAVSIAIPLPLTNFLPALGIVVLSLGLMAKDGLYIIIGNLIGIAGLILTTFVLVLGAKATESIIDATLN